MARILLVEDEPLSRKSTCMFLELKGHEVYQAADGIEALELLAFHNFALVISDLRMPRMDGIQLIQHIRRLRRALPIVITTAYHEGAPDDIPTVAKPLNLEHLSQVIDELLIER